MKENGELVYMIENPQPNSERRELELVTAHALESHRRLKKWYPLAIVVLYLAGTVGIFASGSIYEAAIPIGQILAAYCGFRLLKAYLSAWETVTVDELHRLFESPNEIDKCMVDILSPIFEKQGFLIHRQLRAANSISRRKIASAREEAVNQKWLSGKPLKGDIVS